MTTLDLPVRLLWRASLLCAPLFAVSCACPEIIDDEQPQARAAPPPAPPAAAEKVMQKAPAGEKGAAHQRAGRLRFSVSAATEPHLAAVDGREGRPLIILSLLGDLYRLDPQGGAAVPLTRGGAQDTQPALSPDSQRVAFRSDRDGLPGIYVVRSQGTAAPDRQGACSEGDVLRLSTQDDATHLLPIFSADGRDVVYVRFRGTVAGPETPFELVRQPATGGAAQVLLSLKGQEITGLTRLPSGRLVYAVVQRGGKGGQKSQLFQFPEKVPRQSVPGVVAALETHPLGGVVARLQEGKDGEKENLVWLRLLAEAPQVLRPLSRTGTLPRIGWLQERQQYVVADQGVLRLLRPDGSLAGETHFTAEVDLERAQPAKKAAALGALIPHDKVLLSRSGEMIYAAAGRIYSWHGETGSAAAALTAPEELAYDPALSADGKTLYYCRLGHGGAELLRMSLVPAGKEAPAPQVIYAAPMLSAPALTDGGHGVVVTVTQPSGTSQLYRVPSGGGAAAALSLRGGPDLMASAVPGGICYSGGAGRPGVLYRLADGAALGKPLTTPSSTLSMGICSPDGKALAYLRDGMAWLAPLRTDRPITDAEALPIAPVSPYAGSSLAFAADGRLTLHRPGEVLILSPQRAFGERASLPPAAQDNLASSAQRVHLPQEPAAAERPRKVVVRDVTLLDLEKEQAAAHMTVLIEEGRVRWVGPAKQAPAVPQGARIVEGKGRFAMPGLIEMQGRVGPFDPRAYLAYGITTVRDVQGDHRALDFAAAAEKGTYPLPRILPSADLGHVRTEAEAQRFVNALAEAGVTQLRLSPDLPRNLRRAGGVLALQLGMRLAEQVSTQEDLVAAVEDGVSLISLQERTIPMPQEDVLQLLARSGVAIASLLHPGGLAEQMLRSGYPAHNTVLFELAVSREAQAAHKAAYPGSASPAAEEKVGRLVAQLQRHHLAGIRLVAGSDAGTAGSFPGISLVWELQALGRAGVPPWQVLRMATTQAAAALPDSGLGRIAPGAPADLILLSGNPAEDLSNLERVVTVVRGGNVYRPEMLLIDEKMRTSAGAE